MAGLGRPLRDNYEAFAQEFVRTGCRIAAYSVTGGRAKDKYQAGSAILYRDDVKARIAELREQAASRVMTEVAATEEEVHGNLRWAITTARTGNPILDKNGTVMKDDEGQIIRRPDLPSFLKGTEMLGKTIAMFSEKRIVEDELTKKSDSELAAYIEGLISSDPSLAEQLAKNPELKRQVEEHAQRELTAGEGAEGGGEEEAQSMGSAPQATSAPSRGLH